MKAQKPEVGTVVFWYPGGERHQEPLPAIVTSVADHTLCLHVMSRELKNFMIKDGVRHLEDESAKKPELQEMGAWDHTNTTKWLLRMAAEWDRANGAASEGRKKS